LLNPNIRFSELVRKGLRFRRRFEEAKCSVVPCDFTWYPYDSFSNLFYVQRLLRDTNLSLKVLSGGDPVLDIGAADGALSFFLESLGYGVHAYDHSGTNINRMLGIRALASALDSKIKIEDTDIDGSFNLQGQYGIALFLGTLYHLKNPFYVLEKLSAHVRYCFLSTRIVRFGPDKTVRLDSIAVAYLVDPEECNSDITNYWIFSQPGILRLAKRTGWQVCSMTSSGASESDPITEQGDERIFLLLRSTRSSLEP